MTIELPSDVVVGPLPLLLVLLSLPLLLVLSMLPIRERCEEGNPQQSTPRIVDVRSNQVDTTDRPCVYVWHGMFGFG